MGKPKFPRRKYDVPLHPWKEERIQSERELIKKYGLKNHREVWKAKTVLRKYRRQARLLLGKIEGSDPQVKKESNQLLLHLTRMSILPEACTLDDVLALDTEIILSRRLQTLVYHRGFAHTITHARELISHGHIGIGNQKMTIPGYLVEKAEENQIAYMSKSPLNVVSHPARPKADIHKMPPKESVPVVKEAPKVEKKEQTPESVKKEAPVSPKPDSTPSEPKPEHMKKEEPQKPEPPAEKPVKQKKEPIPASEPKPEPAIKEEKQTPEPSQQKQDTQKKEKKQDTTVKEEKTEPEVN